MIPKIEIVKFGKFSARNSTGLEMRQYFHHFIELSNPILVSQTHMATGFMTISRRSNRTGATTSNEIRFLQISKLKKDGSISKRKSFTEFSLRSDKIDKKGIEHFNEMFKLSKEYNSFYKMQEDIGKGMYQEYKFNMPEFHLNPIAMDVYLKLREKGKYDQEEARLEARNRILTVKAEFIGNDPIIGMSPNQPKKYKISEELINSQIIKVNKIQKHILTEHPMNIDFTDYNKLLEEKHKLSLMERGIYKE